MMECKVNWLPSSGMAFMAETSTGHILNMDGAPESGGRNLAPRPMELMLAGAGGCTAFDVVLILQRSRQNVSACELSMQAERAETDPKVFTKINAWSPRLANQSGVFYRENLFHIPDLVRDPCISLIQPIMKRDRIIPIKFTTDESIVRVSTRYPSRSIKNIFYSKAFTRNLGNSPHKLVNSHNLF